MLLEIVLGRIWAWMFKSEVPTGLCITGGTVVILAVTERALFEAPDNRQATTRQTEPDVESSQTSSFALVEHGEKSTKALRLPVVLSLVIQIFYHGCPFFII